MKVGHRLATDSLKVRGRYFVANYERFAIFSKFFYAHLSFL